MEYILRRDDFYIRDCSHTFGIKTTKVADEAKIYRVRKEAEIDRYSITHGLGIFFDVVPRVEPTVNVELTKSQLNILISKLDKAISKEYINLSALLMATHNSIKD